MLNHVLLPLDRSEHAHRALHYARELVGSAGKITLLTVIRAPSTLYYEGNPYTPPQREYSASEYDAILKEAEDDARAYLRGIATTDDLSGLDVGLSVYVGEPAGAILEAAAELKVEAVVMASHGRTGVGRWLFGSVTQKVLSAAEVPVFVVPSRQTA
ncbi:MAG: universal stress protein [Anaerolineales bacterium]